MLHKLFLICNGLGFFAFRNILLYVTLYFFCCCSEAYQHAFVLNSTGFKLDDYFLCHIYLVFAFLFI